MLLCLVYKLLQLQACLILAGKRVAQTNEEGYDCGDRGWIEEAETMQMSDLLWDKQPADAII